MIVDLIERYYLKKHHSINDIELLLKDNLDNRVEIKECSPNLPFKKSLLSANKKIAKIAVKNRIIITVKILRN